MEALHRRFDETVMLGSRVGDSVVYTDSVESTQVIRYSAPLHTGRPLYPTSAGRCFLAFAPEQVREAFLADRFVDADQRALVRQELEEVRAEGVALNPGQTLPDVSGVGAPVMDNDRVLGVLCVACLDHPAGRATADHRRRGQGRGTRGVRTTHRSLLALILAQDAVPPVVGVGPKLREALGQEEFDGVWAEGSALSTKEAIVYAHRWRRTQTTHHRLGVSHSDRAPSFDSSEGLGNKDIASRRCRSLVVPAQDR